MFDSVCSVADDSSSRVGGVEVAVDPGRAWLCLGHGFHPDMAIVYIVFDFSLFESCQCDAWSVCLHDDVGVDSVLHSVCVSDVQVGPGRRHEAGFDSDSFLLH